MHWGRSDYALANTAKQHTHTQPIAAAQTATTHTNNVFKICYNSVSQYLATEINSTELDTQFANALHYDSAYVAQLTKVPPTLHKYNKKKKKKKTITSDWDLLSCQKAIIVRQKQKPHH